MAFNDLSRVGLRFNAYRTMAAFSSHMRALPIPDIGLLIQLDQIPPAPFRKPRAKPTYRPHSKFSPEDDARLRELVAEHGANSWRAIAKLMPDRNSRQCRERWLNYLNPSLNTNAWTPDEDGLLERAHAAVGPRWVYLTKFFPTRTDAMLKNRFQVLQRKHTRDSAETPTEVSSPVQSPEVYEPMEFWFESTSGQLGDQRDSREVFESAFGF
jgi:hypothetical protein